MTPEQQQHFAEEAKKTSTFEPVIPKGYVYVGPFPFHNGLSSKEKGDFIGLDGGDWDMGIFYRGNSSQSYIAKISFWEAETGLKYDEVFNCEKEITIRELAAKIKEAKKLIGKVVKRKDEAFKTGEVLKTKTFFDAEILEKDREYNSTIVQKFCKKHGYVIGMRGVGFALPFDLVEEFTPVIVNGYPAEKRAGYYKFGCAQIDFRMLVEAKNFLSQTAQGQGNRAPKSVKIGDGEFTLDILNQLDFS